MKRNLRSSVAQFPAGRALAIAFELFQCPLWSSRYEATDRATVLGVFVLGFKLPLTAGEETKTLHSELQLLNSYGIGRHYSEH